ncbi:RNA polymerase sigma factor [Candidatus Omnitrophota bacterium]
MPVTDFAVNNPGTIVPVDDSELVRQFKNGNEKAFNYLVKRHQPRLRQVATILMKDEQDAMDMVQDVFVKAYFKLRTFREDSALYTWLYRILYNRCISQLRRKKIVTFLSFGEDEKVYDIPCEDPIPDTECERSELMREIMAALEKLPLRQRTAFSLKQLNGLKFIEISDIMGITEGAAKASYFHAVKKLQNLLRNLGDDYGL